MSGGTRGWSTGAALAALPIALAVDLLTMILLRRGWSMGRDASVGLALAVTVVAWGLASRLLDVAMRRRAGGGQTPPG